MAGHPTWWDRLDGTVYQLGSGAKAGQWCAQLDVGYTRKGKRRRSRRFRDTEAAAFDALRELNGQKDGGRVATPKRETVASYLKRWLTDVVSERRENTQDAYRWASGHIIEHLGRLSLRDLDSVEGVEMIQRMFAELRRKGLGPQSVLHVRTVLRTALNTAVRRGHLDRNPVNLTESPGAPKKQVRRLTLVEALRVLEAMQGDRLEAFYLIGLVTGMRIGEIAGLQWSDLRFEEGSDEGSLRVRRRLEYGTAPWRLEPVKSEGSEGSEFLPPLVVLALREHRQRQREDRLKAGPAWQDHGFVFTTKNGTPFRPTIITSRYLKALLAKAGVPAMSFHDFGRRTLTTLLAENDVSPAVIQAVLRHRDPRVALQYYTVHSPGMGRIGNELMGRLLSGQTRRDGS